MAENWQTGGFGLYVHWPFCEAKCPYCDFNSHVTRKVDHARWRRAFLSEIARVSAETGPRVLSSIFFGGGTPSLMPPDLVGDIVTAACAAWTPANDLEVTLEANPRSVEANRFEGFRDGGVNRISMGLQALNDHDLRQLGRLHSVAEAKAAFDVARSVFHRISFDLIYARQSQSEEDWRRELSEALEMAADHLSLYQLTIEPGTAFWERDRRGALPGLPDEDRAADMYEITQELCDAAGLPAYEVSNHAQPGSESRHNLIYWRYGDYVGIGPGAHGRLGSGDGRIATEAWRNPGAWLDAAEAGDGTRITNPVPRDEQATECLMMGLRLREGLLLQRLQALDPRVASARARAALQEDGLIWERDGQVGATDRGRLLLNSVVGALLPDQP
ncbi:oxygen-independent coproporphyrinogen-3 oxidase [Roseivivax lentus]|uniref:Heme chaperone HemW n=1 Tax=Roseivivax lentus TaxID=633194 RepID=A0A1N7JPF7_9RHOB|nr:radical SAM family heme chaperone HemW [Roseivivax lentus]SIS51187.1 oxygen-independent coproporphyrinogen-3 oxidase [Roseivivax lentus]